MRCGSKCVIKWFDYFISTVFFRNVSEEDSVHLSQLKPSKSYVETNGRYPPHSRFGRRLLIWNNQITSSHFDPGRSGTAVGRSDGTVYVHDCAFLCMRVHLCVCLSVHDSVCLCICACVWIHPTWRPGLPVSRTLQVDSSNRPYYGLMCVYQ